jgi:hypothetical protein
VSHEVSWLLSAPRYGLPTIGRSCLKQRKYNRCVFGEGDWLFGGSLTEEAAPLVGDDTLSSQLQLILWLAAQRVPRHLRLRLSALPKLEGGRTRRRCQLLRH